MWENILHIIVKTYIDYCYPSLSFLHEQKGTIAVECHYSYPVFLCIARRENSFLFFFEMRSGRNWQGMQYLSMNSNFQGCILRICKNLSKTHKPTHLILGTFLVMMLPYLGPFLTGKLLWKCTQTQKRQDLIRCFTNWNAPLSFTWNQTAMQADQQRKLLVENGASSLFDLSPSVLFSSVWRGCNVNE